VKKLAQMHSIAEHLLLVPSVAQEHFFGQGVGGRKYKILFDPKLPSILTGNVQWE